MRWQINAAFAASAAGIATFLCHEDQVIKQHADLTNFWTACGRPVEPVFSERTSAAAMQCAEEPAMAETGEWRMCGIQIPTPPIIQRDLNEVDPPRSVSAIDYHPTYCASWNDGCTVCFRKAGETSPTCNKHSTSGKFCNKHNTACYGGDYNKLAQYCKIAQFYYTRISSENTEIFSAREETINWKFNPRSWMWSPSSKARDLGPDAAREQFINVGTNFATERDRIRWKRTSDVRCVQAITFKNFDR